MSALQEKKTKITSFVGDAASRGLKGHVLLGSFLQSQDLQMSAELSEGSVLFLRGPVDMVKWKELHIFHDTLKAAIVLAGLVPSELLCCAPFIRKAASGWSPGLELWADASQNSCIDYKKIETVKDLVLAGLTRDAANDADDFASMDLELTERVAVQQAVAESLGSIGGKKLSEPVYVQTEGHPLKIEGKLGAKPSQANFHPIEENICGSFIGFDLYKEELFFQAGEKRIQINFGKIPIDLVEVARAARDRRECTVRTHKIISPNGRDEYAYLPDVPFKPLNS